MRINSFIFTIVLFVLSVLTCYSNDITGVWNDLKTYNKEFMKEKSFSWGNTLILGNSSIVIDDQADEPEFYVGGYGSFPIVSVNEQSEDTVKMIFNFTRGGFLVECIIHFIDENTIWIEETKGISFLPTGSDSLLYRYENGKPVGSYAHEK